MTRLLDAYTALFSFGVELGRRIAAGSASDDPQQLQERILQALASARQQALDAGKRPEQVDNCAFALVAWIDEIMIRNPAWWSSITPLQVSLFKTNNAGNEFFEHLALLGSQDDEVREVYYHALLLGFVGQYYYEVGENGELGKLRELHVRQLPVAPIALHTLREDPITPQPYGEADPPGPRYPRQWDRLLLAGGALLALLIPLSYLGWLLLSPQGPSLAEQVDARLRDFACAELAAEVDDAQSSVRVSGYLPRREDEGRLRQAIQGLSGVKESSFELAIRIWPHCEVVELLKPWHQRNRGGRHGLTVTPTTGHSERFEEDERVTVKLRQADFDSYLYVDYYTVDGTVIHLYPNRREPDSGRLITAGENFTVGERIAEGWEVGPPFGQELISVIASRTPLYQGERVEFEPSSEYLPQLRTLLAAQASDSVLLADFLFLQTEPKKRQTP
ncbi:DotU/TssL family secretion system protein [Azotobacter chroococcum]|uniref:DotU/TssL family secretion system protein n=1 Tax=Azotobacter chroococcum TaxID=353 RepID=UPI00146EC3C4|nr:DotU/TssL family secretion system protein [Azotobacter chroococcum]